MTNGDRPLGNDDARPLRAPSPEGPTKRPLWVEFWPTIEEEIAPILAGIGLSIGWPRY